MTLVEMMEMVLVALGNGLCIVTFRDVYTWYIVTAVVFSFCSKAKKKR